jgi:cobalamin synthase
MPPRPGVIARSGSGAIGTFEAALALLTRLPVRPRNGLASGAAAFPVVGAVVGVAGLVPLVLGAAVEPVLASLLAIAAMNVLTGTLAAGAALVVASVVARTLSVIAIVLARSRVEGGGFGSWFAARVGQGDALTAVVIAALVTGALTLATRSAGVGLGGLVGAGAGLAIAGGIVRGRRQLDGDGMGAIIELTLAASLAAAAFVA